MLQHSQKGRRANTTGFEASHIGEVGASVDMAPFGTCLASMGQLPKTSYMPGGCHMLVNRVRFTLESPGFGALSSIDTRLEVRA